LFGGAPARARLVDNALMPTQQDMIIEALTRALEPEPTVFAAWLAGSHAFGESDDLSDIDLQVDVDDDHVDHTWDLIEGALGELDYRYEMPMPTWHGHRQRFFHVAGTHPLLLLDVIVKRHSDEWALTEVERHGKPVVLFDKKGVVTTTTLDVDALESTLDDRRRRISGILPLARILVAKEISRGDSTAAIAFYNRLVLASLVEALRIRHCPERHDFGMRYLKRDLPPQEHSLVARLAFVADLGDLAVKLPEAVAATEAALR
jgi:predicted nucleotidyltransferase